MAKGHVVLYAHKEPGCYELRVLFPQTDAPTLMYAEDLPDVGRIVLAPTGCYYRVLPRSDTEIESEVVLLGPIEADDGA